MTHFWEQKYGSMTVLLVDDDDDLLLATSELLAVFGFNVLTASGGARALEILQQERRIDAVVTDVMMPGMNGVQLAYEVRQRAPSIKVVLVSGYPNLPLVRDEEDRYDFDFLQKPYRAEALVRLLLK